MKFILCLLTILLSIAMYPKIMLVNGDLSYLFNRIEVDFYNWYRMLVVVFIGIPLLLYFRDTGWLLGGYLILLLLSVVTSRFPETSLYGGPMHHEGAFALLGYAGIYQATKKYGIFKSLERCLDAVVYLTAAFGIINVVYGSYINLLKLAVPIPNLQIAIKSWPIYANMPGANPLGLFCALFLPYIIIKRKTPQAIILMTLLIGSQTRGAWVSAFITTLIISRRYLLYLILVGLILSIPMHDIVTWRIKRTMGEIHYPIKDTDIGGRAYIWKRSLPALGETVLFGKGPATFMNYFPQLTKRGDEAGFNTLAVDVPHNMFINIWVSTGFVSLMILAMLVSKHLYFATNAALKMGCIGFLLAGIFTDSVLCVTPYFLIFLGGIAHEYNEKRRTRKGTKRVNMGGGGTSNSILNTFCTAN